MAWTAANPVSIGNATKKAHYDVLWDNAQYLKGASFGTNRKLFSTAAGTDTEWAYGLAFVPFTRDMSLAAGDIDYPGFGFVPKALICFCTINATVATCWGISVDTTNYCIPSNRDGSAGVFEIVTDRLIQIYESSGHTQAALVKTLGETVTLTWNKAGDPTSTISGFFLAIR